MDKLIYKRKLPYWQIILGCLALAVGAISLFSDFKGFIAIGTGVYLLLTEGSEFNFNKNQFRRIKSILGITIGKWQPLPDFQYVSIFKTTENATFRSRTAETNVSKEVIKLNLFYSDNQRIEAYNTYDLDDAFKKAKVIAEALNIDILDATNRESKWL